MSSPQESKGECARAEGVQEGFSEEEYLSCVMKVVKDFPGEKVTGQKGEVCTKVWRQHTSQNAGEKPEIFPFFPTILTIPMMMVMFLTFSQLCELTGPTGGLPATTESPLCVKSPLYTEVSFYDGSVELADGTSTGKDPLTLGLPFGKPKGTEFQVSWRWSSYCVPLPGSQQR